MFVVPVSLGTYFGIFAGVFLVVGLLLVLMSLPRWVGGLAEWTVTRALEPDRRRNRYVSPFDPANRKPH
ncbi:MAG: hypothetical protein ACAH22_00075 [Tardiphaga sp.]